ncbi:MAG: Uma2 family endonuclease [Cyanobacteria bacterium J06632_22]
MTQAKAKPITFDEYLAHDDGTDKCYEWINGELIEVPPETEENAYRAFSLLLALSKFIDIRRLKVQKLEVEVPALSGMPSNRQPDLTVLDEGHIEEMAAINQMAIRLSMAPPLMVVEVVSPYSSQGDANYRRDYEDKRQQYEQCGIPEYWIVDPTARQVTVLTLVDGQYQPVVFEDSQLIVSVTFPALKIVASDVLRV